MDLSIARVKVTKIEVKIKAATEQTFHRSRAKLEQAGGIINDAKREAAIANDVGIR